MYLTSGFIDLPTVSEREEDDIIDFGLKHNVDSLGITFTRNSADIEQVRNLIARKAPHIKIFAKIENHDGVKNFEDILAAADGVIINRLNLKYEYPPNKLFMIFKWMTEKANMAQKPIIIWKDVLTSMITGQNSEPTRYEVSELALLINEGVDGLMLSEEVSHGAAPD